MRAVDLGPMIPPPQWRRIWEGKIMIAMVNFVQCFVSSECNCSCGYIPRQILCLPPQIAHCSWSWWPPRALQVHPCPHWTKNKAGSTVLKSATFQHCFAIAINSMWCITTRHVWLQKSHHQVRWSWNDVQLTGWSVWRQPTCTSFCAPACPVWPCPWRCSMGHPSCGRELAGKQRAGKGNTGRNWYYSSTGQQTT